MTIICRSIEEAIERCDREAAEAFLPEACIVQDMGTYIGGDLMPRDVFMQLYAGRCMA
jgi:hypothetical protein